MDTILIRHYFDGMVGAIVVALLFKRGVLDSEINNNIYIGVHLTCFWLTARTDKGIFISL